MTVLLRIAAVIAFVLVFATFVVGGHFYLVERLIAETAPPEPWPSLLTGLVWTLCGSIVAYPFAERLLPPLVGRALCWPALLWMGQGFLLVCALGATDLIWWVVGSPVLASGFEGGFDPVAPARGRAALVLGVGLLAGGAALRNALGGPRLVRIAIELARWPRGLDGFRIVQISDIHIGPLLGREFAASVTAAVNALDPDLIAVTGDLVDGPIARLREEVTPFGALRARHGVFFVTGNHDYFSDVDPWVERVEELGIRALRNARVEIGEGDARFDLAGVEDHRSGLVPGGMPEDVPGALEGRDPERAVVLLAHDPGTFAEASRLGVDLQLSGHTHGGQIWPFRYLVRLAIRWVAGLYEERGAKLYVSRGTGFWGPPMRLFAPAEITEITLRAGDVVD